LKKYIGTILTLLAAAAGLPAAVPDILVPPVSQRVLAGDTVSLSVVVTPGVEVSWRKDREPVPAATGSTLTIANSGLQHRGLYQAVASNRDGERWSRAARLEVDFRPPATGVTDRNFFTPRLGGQTVRAICQLPGGDTIAAGDFLVSGTTITNLVRLDNNGKVVADFNRGGTGVDDDIRAMACSGDRIVIGGDFNNYNGTICHRIAVLTHEGQLDPTFDHSLGVFDSGTSAPKRILAVAVQPDGKILIGGTFLKLLTRGGEVLDSPFIARLNPDGQPDSSFVTDAVTRGSVRAIRILADGAIALGGNFASPTSRLAVLTGDGSPDPAFALETPPSEQVRAIVETAGGDLLVGGDFTSLGSTPASHLARIRRNGALDSSFAPRLDNEVNTITLTADDQILIGGRFTLVNSVPLRRVAKLRPDGMADIAFDVLGLDEEVNAILPTPAGKIIIGGKFDRPHAKILRIYDSGAPAPDIRVVGQPIPAKIVRGETLSLSVAAESPAVSSYQWMLDRTPIPGADRPEFTILQAKEDDTGVYSVRIDAGDQSVISEGAPVTVSPALPGTAVTFRYASQPGVPILAGTITSEKIFVPDDYILVNVRVEIDITHPQTRFLDIGFLSPDGQKQVKLFNPGGKNGRNLRRTAFDHDTGSRRLISNAVPPYLGTYRPDNQEDPVTGKPRSLVVFRGLQSLGEWVLQIRDSRTGGDAPGELHNWAIELTAAPPPVTFQGFANAFGTGGDHTTDTDGDGFPDLLSYAISSDPREVLQAFAAITAPAPGLSLSHRRWSNPDDLIYFYESSTNLGEWTGTPPLDTFRRVFPNGTEDVFLTFPSHVRFVRLGVR